MSAVRRWMALAAAAFVALTPPRAVGQPEPPPCATTGPASRTEDRPGDALAQRVEQLHREGRWQQALLEARALVAHRQQSAGACDPRLGSAHSDLGALLHEHGELVAAERSLRTAVALLERCGPCAVELGTALDNLAAVRAGRGDPNEARQLLARAVATLEAAGPSAEPTLAIVLRHDGVHHGNAGRWADAERQVRRALRLHEGRGQTLESARDQLALGTLLRNQGKVVQAGEALTAARDIETTLLGPKHPELGRLYRAIGQHFQRSNMPAEAARAYERAEQIIGDSLGPDHPWLAPLYAEWGVMAAQQGDIPTALRVRRRASAIEEQTLERLFVGGSELDRLMFAKTLQQSLDRTMAMQHVLGGRSPEMVTLGLEAVLRTKGRVLDVAAGEMARLRSSLEPTDRALLDRIASLRSELAGRALAGPGESEVGRYRAELSGLEQQSAELERTVAERSSRLRMATAPVTLAAVQQQLPPDVALIEYVRYQPRSLVAFSAAAERVGPPRYLAWVVRHTGTPAFMQLGLDAPTLDRLVEQLRTRLQDPADRRGLELASRLWPVVVGRLEPVLEGVRHLIIVPDGALTLLPFAALLDLEGRPLIDRYRLSTLSSGRELLRMGAREPSRARAVIVASPDYELGPSPLPVVAAPSVGAAVPSAVGDEESRADRDGSGSDGPRRHGVRFSPLPATAQEALAIAALMPGSSIWRGADATEQAVKELAGPKLLHVATHGFFFRGPSPSLGGSRRRSTPAASARDDEPGEPAGGARATEASSALLEAPLTRSGLALAGANMASGDEDGVLTALEVASLDLRGTELVVLSACDTGLGSLQVGEGVLGLRRALVLAGAQSAVLSLWKVDDEATRALMVAFYRRLLTDRLGRAEALRQAQLEIAGTERWRHPAYWASFVLSGAWTPLSSPSEASAEASEPGAHPTVTPVHPASGGACGCRVGPADLDRPRSYAAVLLALLAGAHRRSRRRRSMAAAPAAASSQP